MKLSNSDVLYKVAEKFGLKRNSTENRLVLQKTIYLLQAYGLRLGYGFSWYRYGPYSQDLVYDAYDALANEHDEHCSRAESWNFSNATKEKFTEFQEQFGVALRDPHKLELTASVHFLRRTWYPDATCEDMPKLLSKHKTQYRDGVKIEDAHVDEAFGLCEKLGN